MLIETKNVPVLDLMKCSPRTDCLDEEIVSAVKKKHIDTDVFFSLLYYLGGKARMVCFFFFTNYGCQEFENKQIIKEKEKMKGNYYC